MSSPFNQIALPREKKNNSWYHYNPESDIAIVFVHGFRSNSDTCWKTEGQYWPTLVRDDQRFKNSSIFLGGYYTAIDSAHYNIRDCADELLRSLERSDAESRGPVISRRHLLFVCHSLGGVVTRYMIEAHINKFAGKTIGLALMASPSIGSEYANSLAGLADFYRNKVAVQLRYMSEALADLDARFKTLLHEKRIPNLVGSEAIEHHFPWRLWFLPGPRPIVTRDSASRYFPCRVLGGTDHFSIVKPDDREAPGHVFLSDFFTTEFSRVVRQNRQQADAPSCVKHRPRNNLPSPLFPSFGKHNDKLLEVISLLDNMRLVSVSGHSRMQEGEFASMVGQCLLESPDCSFEQIVLVSAQTSYQISGETSVVGNGVTGYWMVYAALANTAGRPELMNTPRGAWLTLVRDVICLKRTLLILDNASAFRDLDVHALLEAEIPRLTILIFGAHDLKGAYPVALHEGPLNEQLTGPSFENLDSRACQLLSTLLIFPGAADVSDISKICGLDTSVMEVSLNELSQRRLIDIREGQAALTSPIRETVASGLNVSTMASVEDAFVHCLTDKAGRIASELWLNGRDASKWLREWGSIVAAMDIARARGWWGSFARLVTAIYPAAFSTGNWEEFLLSCELVFSHRNSLSASPTLFHTVMAQAATICAHHRNLARADIFLAAIKIPDKATTNDVKELMNLYNFGRCVVAVLRDDPKTAKLLTNAIEFEVQRGIEWTQIGFHGWLAIHHCRLGNWLEAWELCKKTLDRALAIGDVRSAAFLAVPLIRAKRMLELYPQAYALGTTLLQRVEGMAERHNVGLIWNELAEVCTQLGKPNEAARYKEMACALLGPLGIDPDTYLFEG